MRVMINDCVHAIAEAYKTEKIFSGFNLVLKTSTGIKYSLPMSEGDIDFAISQLYETGKLIGNWKI